jgi:hypothetical protein
MQEHHAAADRAHIRRWVHLFQKQGRDIELARIIPNPNPGATLPLVAVFEGPDATPHWWSPIQPTR